MQPPAISSARRLAVNDEAGARKSSDAEQDGAGDLVRVVIDGGDGVDVADIDPHSLRLGPGLAVPVDGDAQAEAAEAGGSARLVLRFTAAETGFDCRDDVATLLGSTFDGRAIGGLVYLVPGICAR